MRFTIYTNPFRVFRVVPISWIVLLWDYNRNAIVFHPVRGETLLKTLRLLTVLLLLCAICDVAGAQHHSGPKVYEEFHDVLHPLEHEALPNKDYRRIRAGAPELVKRGKAIVKSGVPATLTGDKRTEFVLEMSTFNAALNQLKSAARRSSNAKLARSYSAVHDSFEKLMHMLPR